MKKRQTKKSKIFIFIIILSIVLICTYLFWDRVAFVIDKHLPKLGDEEKAQDYYERIASKFNNKTIAIKRGNLQIKKILADDNYSYFLNNMRINPRSWGGGSSIVPIGSFQNANEDYEVIKGKNRPSNELGEYEIGVSILNWFGGNSDRAIEILENLDYLKSDKLETTRKLNLAAMYINLSRFEEADELIAQTVKENDLYNYFKRDLLSYIYFLRGEENRFEEVALYDYRTLELKGNEIHGRKYNDEKNESLWREMKNLSPYLKVLGGLQHVFQDIQYNKEYYERKQGTNNVLTGLITYNNEPLRGMVVYLKISGDNSISTGGFVDAEVYGITDKNGRYKIKNIPNENYNIGLYGSWNKLKGKQIKLKSKYISFDGETVANENIEMYDCIELKELKYIDDSRIKIAWENPMEGEFEYSIQLGEIRENDSGIEIADFSYMNSLKTEENFIEIDLNKLKKISVGNIYSWGNDFVQPYQVIEPLYHRGQYAIKINSHPINNEYSICGSDNYGIYGNKPYDSIFVEGKQWNEGDKLLLEKKYPEALKWFENRLKENPEDIHSMKILSTVYSEGYKGKEDGGGLIGEDIKKGIKYTEMLKERIGETDHILYTLADLYKKDKQYEKAIEYYLKRVKKSDVPYEYRQIGNIYMKMKKWDEAIKYYKIYSNNTPYKDYTDIILISILMDNKEDILKYSELIETGEYKIDYGELFKIYVRMDRDQYKDIYDLINQEKIEEAKELIKDDNSALGVFYRGLLLLSEKWAYYEDEKEEEIYYSLYKSQENNTLKTLMKYFGQSEIVSDFGERTYLPER